MRTRRSALRTYGSTLVVLFQDNSECFLLHQSAQCHADFEVACASLFPSQFQVMNSESFAVQISFRLRLLVLLAQAGEHALSKHPRYDSKQYNLPLTIAFNTG
ncbi:hypothetical protein BDN72DRAFT_284257 [Pluteus cervinus]|uniref:Uncharacterized protein n=1 Tax=Pluteus cervinus TaxID=181527 RepID=A0ACD3B4P7_9AGAR|nr:hypothetical protein BDN72DRAFT_284257 [Pluteus cervinus]